MAGNKALFAWARHVRAHNAGESVPQRPDLGELKRRLQRRQGARGPFDDVDAKTEEQYALIAKLLREDGSAPPAAQELIDSVTLRRVLVELDREALEIERERAELTPSWWVRLLRWFASKV